MTTLPIINLPEEVYMTLAENLRDKYEALEDVFMPVDKDIKEFYEKTGNLGWRDVNFRDNKAIDYMNYRLLTDDGIKTIKSDYMLAEILKEKFGEYERDGRQDFAMPLLQAYNNIESCLSNLQVDLYYALGLDKPNGCFFSPDVCVDTIKIVDTWCMNTDLFENITFDCTIGRKTVVEDFNSNKEYSQLELIANEIDLLKWYAEQKDSMDSRVLKRYSDIYKETLIDILEYNPDESLKKFTSYKSGDDRNNLDVLNGLYKRGFFSHNDIARITPHRHSMSYIYDWHKMSLIYDGNTDKKINAIKFNFNDENVKDGNGLLTGSIEIDDRVFQKGKLTRVDLHSDDIGDNEYERSKSDLKEIYERFEQVFGYKYNRDLVKDDKVTINFKVALKNHYPNNVITLNIRDYPSKTIPLFKNEVYDLDCFYKDFLADREIAENERKNEEFDR